MWVRKSAVVMHQHYSKIVTVKTLPSKPWPSYNYRRTPNILRFNMIYPVDGDTVKEDGIVNFYVNICTAVYSTSYIRTLF